MTVAATGSRAKRSSMKVLTVASSNVPTMTGSPVWHRGEAHAARAISRLRELRGTVLPSSVHGGRFGMVHARRCSADLSRGANGHQDRRLAPAEGRTAAHVRVRGVRQEGTALHGVRVTPGALPDIR